MAINRRRFLKASLAGSAAVFGTKLHGMDHANLGVEKS
ncbi:MAG: twin-arginine translocation signal domain-containing protein, partial [Bacteroidales bacterium]|nr:twin-arginine translocation signal domain-containing protein [Bacteroidales bacterium]